MAINALVTRQFLRRLRSPSSLLGLLLCLVGVAGFFLLAYRDLLLGLRSNPNAEEQASGLVLLWGYRDAVLAVLMVVSPLLGVRAVSEEREGRSLDLLFTAPLSRLSFLAAKVGSTMILVTLGLIATLPFVAVTALMGGVGPWDLFWCFTAHLSSAFFYLVLGWYAGHQDVPAGEALQGAYGLVGLFHGPVILMLLFYVGLAIPGKLSGMAIEGALTAMLGFNFIITLSNILAGSLFLINVSKRLGQESGIQRRRVRKIRKQRRLRRWLWSLLGELEDEGPLPDHMDPVYARDLTMLRRASLSSTFDLPTFLFVLSFLLFPLIKIPELFIWFGLLVAWIPNVLLASRVLAIEYERETWDLVSTVLRRSRDIFAAKFRLVIRHAFLHIYAYLLPAGLVGAFVAGLSEMMSPGSTSLSDGVTVVSYIVGIPVLGATAVFYGTVGLAASVWTKRQYPALLLGLSIVGGLVLLPVFAAGLGGVGYDIATMTHPAYALGAIKTDGLEGIGVSVVLVAWMGLATILLYAVVRNKAETKV